MRPARELVARYAGTCADCGQPIDIGERITYRRPDAVHADRCTLPDAPTTTHRERLEAKADRRDSWAESRATKAAALRERNESDPRRRDWAFITQPGHIPERARMNARDDRAHEHRQAAEAHASRADGIRSQLAGAIYDDDPDALDRLREKLAQLEAKRENAKQRNAAYRKEHAAELKTMTPYERGQAVPFPSYYGQNLSGLISTTRKRIERLSR